MVLSFHYPQPQSFDRPQQVRVGVVESLCNTHMFYHILQFKNVSAFTTVHVVYSCDSQIPWKVRQGARVVVRNVPRDVAASSMPGTEGPENPSHVHPWSSSGGGSSGDGSRAAAADSRERERSRERPPVRTPPVRPPPVLPPLQNMAALEPLSRADRHYHYVQCPVLCLDSNGIHVKGVTACGLYFVFVSLVVLKF